MSEPEPITDGDELLDRDDIATIPAGPGMSFRGGAADWWEVGPTYTHAGWLHTSREPRVATDNFRDRAVTVLFGRTGRDLLGRTAFPDEQETLFLPGARFRLLRRGEVGDLTVNLVSVLRDDGVEDPPADPDDAATRAAAVLTRARDLPAVAVPRPGRFRGPFGRRPD